MTRSRLAAALAALIALATFTTPAQADNFAVKDPSGATLSMCSRLVLGVQIPCHLIEGMFGGSPSPVTMTTPGALDVTVVALPAGLATSANQTSQLTQQTAAATGIGAPADAAWSGSGSGGLIGIDKAQYAKLEAVRALIAGTQQTVNSVVGTVTYLADGSDGSLQSFKDVRPTSSNITAADVGTTSAAGQAGVNLVSGTPTTNSFQTQAINNQSSATVTTTGTFVATHQIEASYNGGTTYVPVSGLLRGTSTTTSSISGPGVISLDVTGATHLRVRATAYTSGTAVVQMAFSNAPGMTKILNPVKVLDQASSPFAQADTTPFLNMTSATTTRIVTGAASKKTYITHARFHSAGITTSKLVTGTGSNCGTGTADLSETLDLTASDGETFGSGIGPVLIAGTGLDVCVVNSQAINLRVGLAEVQF
jgi:hypothetical protein